jgi:anti-sigma B factor antagonist
MLFIHVPRLAQTIRAFENKVASRANLWQNTSHAFRAPDTMELSIRQVANATVVDVVGDITLYNSPNVRKTLLDLLKTKLAPRVVVNLQQVRYIDSAGVASLVEALKTSRDLKSGFALYGLTKTTREVLELTRLIRVFEVYDTEEEALRGKGGNTAQ